MTYAGAAPCNIQHQKASYSMPNTQFLVQVMCIFNVQFSWVHDWEKVMLASEHLKQCIVYYREE